MSESALARAVRDEIRGNANFENRQVNVEFDERAPATVGDMYVMVLFGGVEPGPRHNSSGGVIDKLYGTDVVLAMRSPKVPRDRQREIWIDTTKSFETLIKEIESEIDFSYDVLSTANTTISTEYSSTDGFIEPLKFAGVGPIRIAGPEVFASNFGQPALLRTVRFRGARRIENR